MIPFIDLRAQYEQTKDEILAAVAGVLKSTQYILGNEVAAFEEEFASYCCVEHCVALNTGTSSLHLAQLACGLEPGDEVITTPMTFVATAAAITYVGATPVFVDVNPRSLTIDPVLIEEKITARTKAIIPVHLYGQPADMDPIMAVARKHGLHVIEDACQAHGARYKDRSVGSIGHIGCFSFYPSKNLGACGEGGALVTSDPVLAQRVRMMRDWGQKERYNHVMKGFNYRMDGVQGAVLRIKLRHLDGWNSSRKEHAAIYSTLLAGSGCETVEAMPYCTRHVHHIYPVLLQDRETMRGHLSTCEIQTGIHYPYPVHFLEPYRYLGYEEGDFPVSESIAKRELSLPMFPELTVEQIETVCQAVAQALQEE